ncbi:MAG: hypothetical protein LQ340_005466 [Diploschistes diacapsis]|nr:MAG: hypothetical protein LQ340_005466 [Diploschistes diacapsis]
MSVAANEQRPVSLKSQGSEQRQRDGTDSTRAQPSRAQKEGVRCTDNSLLLAEAKGNIIDDVSRVLGIMKVENDQDRSHYLGASHWVAVGLNEIADFRTYLSENHREIEFEALEKRRLLAATPANSMSLLRGTAPNVSKDEVISWIPPRLIADELVTRFFESHNPTAPLTHRPSFYQEYSEFWLNPSKTTFAWLAVFFAIFRIAEAQKETNEISTDISPDHFDLIALYKRLTIQCLIAADYTNPTMLILKAMLLYLESEWLTSQDSKIEISLVLGLAIRLAMSMGIHREWKSHAELTPFQAEMRRRLWSALHCMDILYSFQLSLPCTVQQNDCDCALPRNLRDEDFGKLSESLPPSRPKTEITGVSHLIIKRQLCFVLDRVVKATEHIGEIPRDQVRKLEEEMLASRNAIPPHLQMTFAANDVRIWGFDRRPEMIAALERSIEFWRIAKSDSIEAAKAWGLFSFAVKKTKQMLSDTMLQTPQDDQVPGAKDAAIDEPTYTREVPTQTALEFDWELWNEWNKYTENDEEYESLLQLGPENQTVGSFSEIWNANL